MISLNVLSPNYVAHVFQIIPLFQGKDKFRYWIDLLKNRICCEKHVKLHKKKLFEIVRGHRNGFAKKWC